MKADIWIVVVLIGTMGGEVAAAENISGPAPLTHFERTIGVCHPIENRLESKLSAVNGFSPVLSAIAYLEDFERQEINRRADFVSIFKASKMTLIQAPKHGELLLDSDSGAYFSADYNYEGLDSTTILVEVGGYKVKVIYRFVLMKNVPGSSDQGSATDDKKICPNGYRWKISELFDANHEGIKEARLES